MQIPSWLRSDPPVNPTEARLRALRAVPSLLGVVAFVIAIVTQNVLVLIAGVILALIVELVISALSVANLRRHLRTVTITERTALIRRRRLMNAQSQLVVVAFVTAALSLASIVILVVNAGSAQTWVAIVAALFALLSIGSVLGIRALSKTLAT